MKAKSLHAIVFLLFIPLASFAQESEIGNLNKLLREKHYEMVNVNDPMYEEIEGSPYLSEEYLTSKLFFKKYDKPYGAQLKYNAYSGQFEFTQGEHQFAISNVEEIDSIFYMGYDFVPTSYIKGSGQTLEAFLSRLVKGKCSLYKIHRIEFHKAEPPSSGYEQYKPARFEEEPPVYCIQMKGDSAPKEITSFRRNKFLDHFGDLEPTLKKYIKDQNIRLRQEEDLVRFIKYYNTHYGK